ncbi:MAG: 6-bladed beta-propeller [Bacteroidia bacterium]|nr:6-bladed beta-propeller [Bacteroidia bacterium]
MSYRLIILAILSIFCSCHNNSIDKNPIKKIKLYENLSTECEIKLSSIAENISYVQLETNDSCIVGRIDSFIAGKEFFLVYDRMLINLLMFDHEGKFLRKISNNGEGPEEFNKIQCFDMDEVRKEIYIVTYDWKLKVFNYSGKCLSSFNFAFVPFKIRKIDRGFQLVYQHPWSRAFGGFGFGFCDFKGNLVKKDLPRPFNFGMNSDPARFPTAYIFRDTLCFWEQYQDTIWGYSKDLSVKPRWVLDFGKQFSTKEKYDDLQNGRFPLGLEVYGFIEDEKRFYILSVLNNLRNFIVYDKSNSQVYKPVVKNPIQNFGFINDIDGGLPFWPSTCFSNELFSIIEPSQLFMLKKTKNYQNESMKQNPKSIELKRLINNINDYSNPIIAIVKLKN